MIFFFEANQQRIFENSQEIYATAGVKMSKWKIGAELEIFSHSQRQWYPGYVETIESRNGINWISVV